MSSWSWAYLKTLLGFKKEYTNEDFIAVMWPAAYPQGYPAPVDPHCTIVMMGTTDRANFTKEEVLEVIRETLHWNSFLLTTVAGLEWFGPDENVPVLRLEHGLLQKFHDDLKARLKAKGIFVDETYPVYKPHVTITEEAALTRNFPDKIMLTPVQLWWGEEKMSISHG